MPRGMQKPGFDLDEVKQLAIDGHLVIWKRSMDFMKNRDLPIKKTCIEVIDELSADDFYKNIPELDKIPGQSADVYKVYYSKDEYLWYVKLYIERKNNTKLIVLSCYRDGFIH